jgi:AcrR family transcriptional regulator
MSTNLREMRRLHVPASAKAKSKRPRRPRGSLNPADIVAGAFEFCRDTPVDEMTVPQLAVFLDVGVTSIYWYFKSKRELLDAMTEEALVSFYESMPPLRSRGWEDMLREFFVSFYTLLAADQLKCDLIVRRIGNRADDGAIRSWARAEQLLTALADAGFPPSLARHAFFTLSIYTQGFLLVERTGRVSGAISSPPGGSSAGAVTADAAQAPGAGQLSAGSSPPEDFEFGISNIIAGLRQLLPGDVAQAGVA